METFARLLAWARKLSVLFCAPLMETYSILSMVILRVGDVPLALCIDYSKRRASLEK